MSLLEFLGNHIFRNVLFGTVIIGLVSGALGSFAYLRKQSLMSDVVSHAALPGTMIAFLFGVLVLGGDGRNMVSLIVGAMVVGTLAAFFANAIANHSKLKIDSAMAIVLALFFGGGMLLLRIITDSALPGKGGVQNYLFGNASVITSADLITIGITGAIAIVVMMLFFKEFALQSFDKEFARTLGFSSRIVDSVMFISIVVAVVIGVKAVGLVLMVAFMVTPPAAARQWTQKLPSFVALSAAIGALGSAIGAYLSIVWGGIATGPVIVIVLFILFLISLLFSPKRSIIGRALQQRKAKQRLLAALRAEAALALQSQGSPALNQMGG
ncbi:MAG: metal ABC transporter permease, partial [Microbacteriaceae bacterium]